MIFITELVGCLDVNQGFGTCTIYIGLALSTHVEFVDARRAITTAMTTGNTIMFYEGTYTSLGEKIATVIGLLVLMVVLSALMVGFHITMGIA